MNKDQLLLKNLLSQNRQRHADQLCRAPQPGLYTYQGYDATTGLAILRTANGGTVVAPGQNTNGLFSPGQKVRYNGQGLRATADTTPHRRPQPTTVSNKRPDQAEILLVGDISWWVDLQRDTVELTKRLFKFLAQKGKAIHLIPSTGVVKNLPDLPIWATLATEGYSIRSTGATPLPAPIVIVNTAVLTTDQQRRLVQLHKQGSSIIFLGEYLLGGEPNPTYPDDRVAYGAFGFAWQILASYPIFGEKFNPSLTADLGKSIYSPPYNKNYLRPYSPDLPKKYQPLTEGLSQFPSHQDFVVPLLDTVPPFRLYEGLPILSEESVKVYQSRFLSLYESQGRPTPLGFLSLP